MNIVEIIIGIIWNCEYLSDAQKDKLERDIKFDREVESKLKEKEVGIEELTKEIQEIEKKLEKLEKMKEAIQEILIKENYLKKIIKELKNERRGL